MFAMAGKRAGRIAQRPNVDHRRDGWMDVPRREDLTDAGGGRPWGMSGFSETKG